MGVAVGNVQMTPDELRRRRVGCVGRGPGGPRSGHFVWPSGTVLLDHLDHKLTERGGR